ncbi:hypothetical protein LY13_003084 [Prauserella aidingensis]|nr:hypothetical protein [Prauserella aidingensis]
MLNGQEDHNSPRRDKHSGRPGIVRRLLARAIPTPAGVPSYLRPRRAPWPEPDPGGSELPTPSALAPTGFHGTEAGR